MTYQVRHLWRSLTLSLQEKRQGIKLLALKLILLDLFLLLLEGVGNISEIQLANDPIHLGLVVIRILFLVEIHWDRGSAHWCALNHDV